MRLRTLSGKEVLHCFRDCKVMDIQKPPCNLCVSKMEKSLSKRNISITETKHVLEPQEERMNMTFDQLWWANGPTPCRIPGYKPVLKRQE